MSSRYLAAACAVALTSQSACATFLARDREVVSVTSDAGGAEVYVDGVSSGRTPLQLSLDRSQDHIVMVKTSTGAHTCVIAGSVKAEWVLLDVMLGGVPVIVDAVTGKWKSFDSTYCHLAASTVSHVGGSPRRGEEPPTVDWTAAPVEDSPPPKARWGGGSPAAAAPPPPPKSDHAMPATIVDVVSDRPPPSRRPARTHPRRSRSRTPSARQRRGRRVTCDCSPDDSRPPRDRDGDVGVKDRAPRGDRDEHADVAREEAQ